MSIAVINSGSSVSLTFLKEGGKSVIFNTDHPSFSVVAGKLKDGSLTYQEACDLKEVKNGLAARVVAFTQGKCTVENDKVFFEGQEVHHVMVKRIMDFMKLGLPVENLLHCLERTLSNVSAWAVESLWPFLENKGFPITEDGCFIGYKAVHADTYMDLWKGAVDYTPGKSLERVKRLKRNEVDDDRNKECSFGYHVGTLDYALSYGRISGKPFVVVLVKVAPEDVVSVPSEGRARKIRCVWLDILEEYHSQEVIDAQLVDENLDSYEEDEDSDWEDEQDYLEDYFEDEVEEDEDDECYCEECTGDDNDEEEEKTEAAPRRWFW